MSIRFSMRTPSHSYSHTGRPASSRTLATRSASAESIRPGHAFLAVERHRAAVRRYALAEVIEHDHSAERVWQRGDEKAVIAARDDARHAARRVSAQAVRHDPLGVEQLLHSSVAVGRQIERANDFIEEASWHQSE